MKYAYSLIFLSVSIVLAVAHMILMKKPRNLKNIVEVLFLYVIAVNVGAAGLLAYYGHVFMGAEIAKSIGWRAGSGFQYEVGVADLALGVIALLCIWVRGTFWYAAAIANIIFLYGCAVGHIRNIILYGNTALNNAGPTLYIGDLLIPSLLVVLMIMLAVAGRKRTAAKPKAKAKKRK